MNGETFSQRFFNDNATFRLGNFPLSSGLKEIKDAADGMFNMVKKLDHAIVKLQSMDDNSFVVEGTVIYTLKNDTVLQPIVFCSICEMGGSKLNAIRIYGDFSPLLQAMSN